MLKLVFYTGGLNLKVRLALPEDDFGEALNWKEKLSFVIQDSSDFMMTWTSLLPDLEPQYAEAFLDLVSARYPVSPYFHKLEQLCPELLFQNGTREWVFFGGTFDPWHKGHQACLSLLPDDLPCFILPDRNPQKYLRDLNPVTSILEISTRARFKKLHYLVPTFLLTHKKNPTVEWIEKLKTDFPAHKISLLMGFDTFSQLKTWIRIDDLLPLVHTLYVVSRLEDDEDRRLSLDDAHALGSNLNVVFLGRHEFEDLSSTALRNKE